MSQRTVACECISKREQAPRSLQMSERDGGHRPQPATVLKCAFATGLLILSSTLRADDRAALATLENSGASVKRDETLPEKPVAQIIYNLRDVTESGLRALKELEELPAISFVGTGNTELSPAALRALQNKRSLKRFALAYAKVGDDGAKILGSLKSLESLELRSQVEMSPAGVKEILNLVQLKELTLNDRLANDAVLEELTRLSGLKSLTVRSVFVTDEGIKSLRRLKSLRTLKLYLGSAVTEEGLSQLVELNLSELELTYSDVTNDKLKTLRKLSSLKSLRLINAAAVNDEGIPYLSELSELKDLDLANATLTKAGLQQLKKALPKCNVVIEARKRD